MPTNATIQKIFTKACHIGTPEAEAFAALQTLTRLVNTDGSVFDYVLAQKKTRPSSADARGSMRQKDDDIVEDSDSEHNELREDLAAFRVNMERLAEEREKIVREREAWQAVLDEQEVEIEEYRTRLDEQQAVLDGRQAEIDALRAENAALKASIGSKADTGTEFILWDVLKEDGDKVFGCKGWGPRFASAADITVKELTGWRIAGIVPARFLAIMHSLSDEQKLAASRQPWTDAERKRLRTLVTRGVTDREIAKILSKAFGRRLFETSITGARRRFKILRVRRHL